MRVRAPGYVRFEDGAVALWPVGVYFPMVPKQWGTSTGTASIPVEGLEESMIGLGPVNVAGTWHDGAILDARIEPGDALPLVLPMHPNARALGAFTEAECWQANIVAEVDEDHDVFFCGGGADGGQFHQAVAFTDEVLRFHAKLWEMRFPADVFLAVVPADIAPNAYGEVMWRDAQAELAARSVRP